MKWIGQHIWDWAARFRNDVYLEDISSGTIASGGNLGLDSNNKIVKSTVSGGISHDGSTADGVLTYKDADEATVEQYLTFANAGNTSSLEILSNEDTGDKFSISTTTHGATVIRTLDDDATAAHLTFRADGTIYSYSTPGEFYFYKGTNNTDFGQLSVDDDGGVTLASYDDAGARGTLNLLGNSGVLIAPTGGGTEIQNSATGGTACLIIDNNDLDQNALRVDAENTTADILDINAEDLTTGSAIDILCSSLTTGNVLYADINDATTGTNTRDLISIDFDKNGVTGSGNNVTNTGLKIHLQDNATNDGGSVQSYYGVQSLINWASSSGTQSGAALYGKILGCSAGANISGLLLDVEDGSDNIKIRSSANTNDYCAIRTTANGATTIVTSDADAQLAHFEIAAGGDITLDSAGQIKLEPVAGNNILLDGTVTVDGGSVTGITTLGVDSVNLTAVQTSGESFADNDTSIMTSAAIQDKIQAHYSYQYMNFSFKAVNIGPDLWRSPSQNGPEYYEWDNNHGSGVTQAASDAPKDVDIETTISVDYLDQTTGFIIPKACKLDGFYGNIRVNGTNPNTLRPVLGLFRAAEPSDGNQSDLTATCVAFDSYDTASGNRKNRFLKLETSGLDTDLAQGDLIFPAVGWDATASDSLGDMWGSFTIVLKTLIP